MTGIYGLLGLQSGDRTFINTIGASRVFDAAQTYLQVVDQEIRAAAAVFVERTTEKYSMRYKLPGGGRMQARGLYSSNGAVRPHGGWDVALPLVDYEEPVSESDIEAAYLTVEDVQLALENITIRHTNALRYNILKPIFNNTTSAFSDREWGTLTVQPLANGDTVLYPPSFGSETEATRDHYLESGYAGSSISDTNNPYTTIRAKLEELGPLRSGYGNIAVFIHSDQAAKTKALALFDPVSDIAIVSGANTDVPRGMPNVPGRVIGRCDGVWVVEYPAIPTGYMFGVDLDQPAPLMMRVHPAATGLQSGLHLAANSENHPLYSRHYRVSYGIGAGNRLNGVVMELGTGGSYTIPTAYA